MKPSVLCVTALAAAIGLGSAAWAIPASTSYYPVRLDDSAATYATPANFPLRGDGVADDTAALQQAIDAQWSAHKEGIVFLPSGKYRITHTIYVWPSIRIIGYGKTRPTLILAENTPGYQQGIGYMVVFAGARHPYRPGNPLPGTVPPTDVADANPGTFYSAMSNIDFEIRDGNPAAVAIRFHVAQHCFLTHMDFRIGSGLAALHDIGNEAEDLHFYGGQYGILTKAPSPGWQFTLLDSTFQGQRTAAIREHEAGLTLAGDRFLNVPTAISIDAGYPDELWVKDSSFSNISGPAVIISQENNPTTEIHLKNIVCSHVGTIAHLRQSNQNVSGSPGIYSIDTFVHGLIIPDIGEHGTIATSVHLTPLADAPAPPNIIRRSPAENTWVNLRTLGAKGDGQTDDTAAIQNAIDKYPAIYVPSGRYIVTNTIHLQNNTALIGLDPSTTQFDLPDHTPGYQGPGNAKALLESSKGGPNILSGIGIYTNGINSRAAGVIWKAGADSLLDDVRFLGGHGTNNADGSRVNPYNNTHTADPDIHRQWDAQYPSLWVTDSGGGTIADIWTPDTYAQAGMMVSNTSTPGHVYELSSEHHVRNEIILRNAAHWELDALQTEEEWGEGPYALPLEIDNSHDITIANFHSYRVIASYRPYPYAVLVSGSENVHFYNLHVNSNSKVPFDDSIYDQTFNLPVRNYELAVLNITGVHHAPWTPTASAVVPAGARITKLASGFFSLSGAAVDPHGRLYFIDTHWQRIYRWSPATRHAQLIRDQSLRPTELAFDRAGNLIVVSYAGDGTVYTFAPDAADNRVTFLHPVPAAARPGWTAILPDDYWGGHAFQQEVTQQRPYQYLSLDQTTFIPAGKDFVRGSLTWGVKMADILHANSLAAVASGRPFYITEESRQKTYAGTVKADGTLTQLKLFAERGGESVTQDAKGNVYLADGDISIYSPSGKKLGGILVPERPIDLIFGGPARKTLFILTHHALYSIETK
jgi:sugar lactone lactonase YvrE